MIFCRNSFNFFSNTFVKKCLTGGLPILFVALLAACGAGGTDASKPLPDATTGTNTTLTTPRIEEPPLATVPSPTTSSPTTIDPSIFTTTTINETCPRSYVVQDGDSLSVIAERYAGISFEDIVAFNPSRITDPSLIFGGLEICIPFPENLPEVTTTTQPPTTPPTIPNCLRTYTIQSGDSLSAIADRYAGVTLADILRRNPSITDEDAISIGQVICVPTP